MFSSMEGLRAPGLGGYASAAPGIGQSPSLIPQVSSGFSSAAGNADAWPTPVSKTSLGKTYDIHRYYTVVPPWLASLTGRDRVGKAEIVYLREKPAGEGSTQGGSSYVASLSQLMILWQRLWAEQEEFNRTQTTIHAEDRWPWGQGMNHNADDRYRYLFDANDANAYKYKVWIESAQQLTEWYPAGCLVAQKPAYNGTQELSVSVDAHCDDVFNYWVGVPGHRTIHNEPLWVPTLPPIAFEDALPATNTFGGNNQDLTRVVPSEANRWGFVETDRDLPIMQHIDSCHQASYVTKLGLLDHLRNAMSMFTGARVTESDKQSGRVEQFGRIHHIHHPMEREHRFRTGIHAGTNADQKHARQEEIALHRWKQPGYHNYLHEWPQIQAVITLHR